MKKFLILVLAIAIAFSIDCKDLMNSNHIICPIQKKTKQTVNHANCHKSKKNATKDCSCPEKKTISLLESSKVIKNSISLELAFQAPVNFVLQLNLTQNKHYPPLHLDILHIPFLSPTKTIHLLI
jgi:hypothetical protein